MVRINGKKVKADRGGKDIKVGRNAVDANQFLEIATAKSVHIESMECGGMRILAKKIFLDGKIVSSGSIILAAMEIHINREAQPM
ncbi:MAG: hypothetical protein LBD81_00880 [Holosporaceae bacterium]|nr:hypothetical protein [Holosporaceae bacterium]